MKPVDKEKIKEYVKVMDAIKKYAIAEYFVVFKNVRKTWNALNLLIV